MAAFEEFGVLPEIAKSVEEMEWMLPTDVQAEAIPLILGGGDVLMAAETGSGKTGAFCLPILQIVWEALKENENDKSKPGETKTISNVWELSKFDRTPSLAVSMDGLVAQAREIKEWHGCRCSKGVKSKGKYYYEAKVTDEGLCRVGWSTSQASLDLGTDKFGFGYGGTGKKSNCKQFENYGESFAKNDVIGCLLNLDSGEISFSKNGQLFEIAFNIPNQLKNEVFFPTVCMKNAEISFNFGSKPMKYLPNGYIALNEANLGNVVNNERETGAKPIVKKINNAPKAIIIEPSRELAQQTYQQILKFKKYLDQPNVKELLIIGGVNIKDQLGDIEAGVDIVVATPGRLEDFISMGHLSLAQCRFFVLDEADGLLKSGYKNFIHNIYGKIPKFSPDGKRMQMIVCSATLHDFEVKKMAETLMHFPTWVDLKGEDAVPETVHHVVVNVDPQTDLFWEKCQKRVETDGVHYNDKIYPGCRTPEALSEAVKILKAEYAIRAIKKHKIDRAIIFCRTKLDCDNFEKYFKSLGDASFSCVCLHGDRKPNERKSNYDKFKAGHTNFLICTDVAARGIDIGSLPFVLNMNLPDDKANYVHRIGRVGRADKMGLAFSFVSTVPEKVWYHGEWCKTRGKNCYNTKLTDQGGCCIWQNERQYLAEIEDHLNITIDQVGPDMDIPKNEFDGKVIYGEKKINKGSGYKDHTAEMASEVAELAKLESKAQMFYLKRHLKTTGKSIK